MTPEVLKMITHTYKIILKSKIEIANRHYREIWKDLLERYRIDNIRGTLPEDYIIKFDVNPYIKDEDAPIIDLLFSMLREDGFTIGKNNVISLPSAVIVCIANQQEEIQNLALKFKNMI